MPQQLDWMVRASRPGISCRSLLDSRRARRTPSDGSGRAAARARQGGDLSAQLRAGRRSARARGTPRAAGRDRPTAAVVGPRQQRLVLVAQAEQAGRLEADHRQAALDQRSQRRERAPRLAARLLDQADREEGAAAAERPRRRPAPAGGRGSRRPPAPLRAARAISGSNQVVKVSTSSATSRPSPAGAAPSARRRHGCRMPARQRALGAEARAAARRAPPHRAAGRADAAASAARLAWRRVARQIADQPVAGREAVALAGAGAAPRSSSAPCRRRSGIRAGRPCTRRRGRASRPSRPRSARQARAGR